MKKWDVKTNLLFWAFALLALFSLFLIIVSIRDYLGGYQINYEANFPFPNTADKSQSPNLFYWYSFGNFLTYGILLIFAVYGMIRFKNPVLRRLPPRKI